MRIGRKLIFGFSLIVLAIIALTAKALSGDRKAMLDFGFTDYLSKPIEEETLIAMVAKYAHQDT